MLVKRKMVIALSAILLLLAVTGFNIAIVPMPVEVLGKKVLGKDYWPTVRGYHKMYSDGKLIIIAGGEKSNEQNDIDTASLNGVVSYDIESRQWRMDATVIPSSGDMAFDSRRNKIIVYAGWYPPWPYKEGEVLTLAADTYSLDLRNGHLTQLNPSPSAPYGLLGGGGPLVYDSRSDKIVMFGGLDLVLFNQMLLGEPVDFSTMLRSDTWVYNPRTEAWSLMNPPLSPPGRNSHMMVYDSRADRVILFGGGDFFQDFDDTWAYNYHTNTWTNMNPATHPSARAYGSLTYDEKRGVCVLFGGVDYNEALTDNVIWTYDYFKNEWKSIQTVNGPSARGWHDMTYNAREDAIYLYGGGIDRQHFTDEFWVYSPKSHSWHQIPKPQ